MPAPDFRSVDEYIAAQPAEVRGILESVRAAIRSAIPKAEEFISYKIPAYRQPGGTVIFFAGWKKHWSLYPSTEAVVSALGDALTPYEVKKGTIRFPLDKPVPTALIARIARLRAEEVSAKAEAARSRKRRASS